MQLAISKETANIISAGVFALLLLFWAYLLKYALNEQRKKREIEERLVSVLEKLERRLR